MKTLSQLLVERNSLPEGNIYLKTINGGNYYYHQYFYNGKRYSKLLKDNEVEELKEQIKRRKTIDKQIKFLQSKEKIIVLSKNAYSLTGYIMSGNIPVAEYKLGNLLWINEKLAPLVIKRTKSIERFLSLRVLDMSRTNARILKKILNINVDEDFKIPLFSYALAINDNYWFKPKHSKLKYDELVFNNDNFYDAALKGDSTVFTQQSKLTPEITTTGSYEKGWKLIKKEWWLYKSGTKYEYFSELYSSYFAKLLNINTAIYELDGDYIRSKNFAPNTNFEPLASLAGDNQDYNFVFNLLYDLDISLAKDYLKLMFFDAVTYNIDRHNENIGFLRSRKTGKILSLAPNFDNNLSLISTSPLLKKPNKDAFIAIFINFLKGEPKALGLFKTIEFPHITLVDLKEILKNISIKIENEKDFINTLLDRYYFILTNKIF